MSQAYSNPEREQDEHALPDLEVFELNAHEAASMDEDLCWEYSKRFPLATMNSRDRDRMLDAMTEEQGITGGWFYCYCFPGCLPDSPAIGPFATRQEALAAAREEAAS